MSFFNTIVPQILHRTEFLLSTPRPNLCPKNCPGIFINGEKTLALRNEKLMSGHLEL